MNDIDHVRLKLDAAGPRKRRELLDATARANATPEIMAMAERIADSTKNIGISSALVILQAIGLELAALND